MSNEDTRESRIKTLKESQEARKQDAKNRVYEAVERLQKLNAKINFHTVAREAQVSVSYLYKYPELKQYIAELRSQQNSLPVKAVAKPNSTSHGKVITRLQDKLKKLEAENRELKRKNEALAGQAYRVHYLQDQVERQQRTISDLEARIKQAQAQAPSASNSAVKVTPITQAKSLQLSTLIQEELKNSQVKVTSALNRIIKQHDEQAVFLAVKAYNQYRETNQVEKPGACLRRAIEQGWVPNEASAPTTPEQDEFDDFYADAASAGFLVNIPKNHLAIQNGEIMVKVNQASAYAPWTAMPWRQAKVQFEEQHSVL